MNDESQSLDRTDSPQPAPLEKLDRAARLRAEAAQLIAAAEKIEADKARLTKDKTVRDQRIVGAVAMQLAAKSPDLARVLIEGIGACMISGHDRKHLAREGSALAELKTLAKAPASSSAMSVPTIDWFDVTYADRERVPAGVLYDRETKARCAITSAVVMQMRALGFKERVDLADRPPPTLSS